MKRGLNGKSLVISAALFMGVLLFAETVEAQIFGGNRGIFRNRGNNCCVTPVNWNYCCPDYHLNQGANNWNYGNYGTHYGNYGSYTAPLGYQSQGYNSSFDSVATYDANTSIGTTTWSGQQETHNSNAVSGNWSNQFSQKTDTGLTSPGNQANANVAIRSDLQPNLQRDNTETANSTATHSQSHQVLSVRPDGSRTNNDGSQGNIDSRNDQNRYAQTPGDLNPGQNQYQPSRTDGIQPGLDNQDYSRQVADNSAEANDKKMTCFIAHKFAMHNQSASEMAAQISDRLQSDDVKELAKKLEQDHADLAEQFNQVAKSDTTDKTGRDGDGSKELGPYTSLYKMCEIADKNQQEQFNQMISELSENEIDMGYVGTLMVCHRTMLAELEAARETLENDELKSTLDNAIEMVRNHLEKAEQVYEDLKS